MKLIITCLAMLSLTSCTHFVFRTGPIDPYYADCKVEVAQPIQLVYRWYWPTWRFQPRTYVQTSAVYQPYTTHYYNGPRTIVRQPVRIIGGRRK